MDQRHVAKPAGKRIHAALSLGKVVRVSPAGSPRSLGKGRQTRKTMRDMQGTMGTLHKTRVRFEGKQQSLGYGQATTPPLCLGKTQAPVLAFSLARRLSPQNAVFLDVKNIQTKLHVD